VYRKFHYLQGWKRSATQSESHVDANQGNAPIAFLITTSQHLNAKKRLFIGRNDDGN